MAGKLTEELGKNLTQRLNSQSKYHVYYAHGKKTEEKNVCRPTPISRDEYSLSFIDIVIVENAEKKKKVKLLCEIEESGVAPKKIIGDIVNILVSDKMRILGENCEYDRPQLILGLKVNEKGESCQKQNPYVKNLRGL